MIHSATWVVRLVMAAALVFGAARVPARADAAFQKFLQSLWPDAQKFGVSRPTFDAATRGLEPDLTLPDLALPGRVDTAPKQPEFVQTLVKWLESSC